MNIVLEYNEQFVRAVFNDVTDKYKKMSFARREIACVSKESNTTMVLMTFNNNIDQIFIPEVIDKVLNSDTLEEVLISTAANPQEELFKQLEELIK